MFRKLKTAYPAFCYNFPLLVTFLLPFGLNLSIFIVLWSLSFFLFDDVKSGMKKVLANKWSWVLIGFFVLHAIAYFFSTNKAEAATSIEIKLSFLAFPILFFVSNFNEIQIRKIVISFVSGCFLVCLIYLFRAGFLYFFNDFNAFFYSEFTYFMHPSYFAMYLILALLIIMLYYHQWLGHLSNLNVKIGLLSVVFLICIVLASSKMGLITAALILPSTLLTLLYKAGYKKMSIALVLTMIIGVFVMYKLFPDYFGRIKTAINVSSSMETIDKTSAESTAVRILIWDEAVKIIKEQWLFGTTPGDANDALYSAYRTNGMTGALNKNLNAHNQYLQTFIGAGIIGFVLLCMMTLGAMIYGILKRNTMVVLFSILIILNFLVESMLQAQAGFIFFVFFLCLFLKYNLSQQSKLS